MKKWLLHIAFLLATVHAFGQTDTVTTDTTALSPRDSVIQAYSALRYRNWSDLQYRPIDSTIAVGNHWNLNEWTRDIYGQLSMANLATPLAFLVHENENEIGVRSGFESYYRGWDNAKDLRFYDVKAPLSGVRYLSGYQTGQLFGGYFTANVNERFNIFLDYERVAARGNYFSQDNLYDRINSTSHYRTQNNKYSIQGALTWNNNTGRESGGITDETGFSNPDSLITDRELVNVRFYNSFFEARRFELAIEQEYLPFADSTEAKGIGLYHEGEITSSERIFRGADSVLGNYFIDSTFTNDSAYSVVTNQEVGLVFKSGYKAFTYAKVGAGYRYGQLGNDYFLRSETALYLSAELRGEDEKYAWIVDGKYYVAGTQIGAFDVNGRVQFDIGQFDFEGFTRFQQQTPSLQSEEWYANDFIWNNDFLSTYYQKLGGKLGYDRYASFTLNLQNWSRPIYYDEQGLPQQITGAMQLVQAELDLQIPILSWLTVTSRSTLQLTSGSEDILRLPTFFNRSGLFGEWSVFDGALKAYTGVEGTFYSSYQANRYNPVTGVFVLQNNKSIGDFLYLNAIGGFRIGSAEIYVIWENVAEGLLDRAYYASPYYPLADRTLHLGVKWRFFN